MCVNKYSQSAKIWTILEARFCFLAEIPLDSIIPVLVHVQTALTRCIILRNFRISN